MKTILMFPGQGSQYIGMGKDIYDNFLSSKRVFEIVNDAVGFDLADLIFNGTDEELRKSYNTQPALMCVSVSICSAIREVYGDDLKGKLNIKGVAGHSLGEYSSLCISGCLSIDETAKILYKRGEAMYQCVKDDTGMVAVIGCSIDTIQNEINRIKDRRCLVVANSNSVGQVVISGYLDDIEKFKKNIDGKAKKLIPLGVSGAFHSPLMQKAQEKMYDEIEKLNIKEPIYPVLQNYSGKFETDSNAIKKNLQRQITSPVMWCENIQYAIERGFDTFIEIGAKKVLSGLMKRIITKEQEDKIKVISIENVEEVKNMLSCLLE